MSDSKSKIRTLFNDLRAQRDDIAAQAKPLRDERDKILAQIQPLSDKANEIAEKYKEIEKPLYDLDNEISALASALGGKKLSDSNDK